MFDPNRMDLERWALRESRALTRKDWPAGSPKENQVLQAWRTLRPKMVAQLSRPGLTALAHVLVDRWNKATRDYLLAGMPPTDAEEQAAAEWLLMEPEDEPEEPEESPQESEEFAEETKPPPATKPAAKQSSTKPRTAAKPKLTAVEKPKNTVKAAASSAVRETAMGLDEIAKGLQAIFGGKNKLSAD